MCKIFYYKKYDFNEISGILTLTYAVTDNTEEIHDFTETILFPSVPISRIIKYRSILNRLFFLTHIAFGISYYKTFCPEKIVIESGQLTLTEANFFNQFYISGLGEFAIRNNLNLQNKIQFPFSKAESPVFPSVPFRKRFFVPVGGGKDSCVSLHILQSVGADCTTLSVGSPRPIRECVEITGLPHLELKRIIDPHLIELNQTGHVFNGHVPITGMLAFLFWICSIIYDYQYVALSCERSANSGNLMQGNLIVNHQYSKSFSFESDFYKLTQTLTPHFRYFSLLRPLSELHIARLFAQNCTSFFPAFTSCNKAFKLDESKRLNRWCGDCDKCRFVFLILAPFMNKQTLIRLIGRNPLNDLSQLTGYEELLGLSGHKPFECVGEIEESRMAFSLLATQDTWQSDSIIRILKPRLPVFDYNILYNQLMTPSQSHLIPMEILSDVMERFKI